MDQITYYRKKTYSSMGVLYNDAMLQVTFDVPEEYGEEKKTLVEEKINDLFNEVQEILISGADHIA